MRAKAVLVLLAAKSSTQHRAHYPRPGFRGSQAGAQGSGGSPPGTPMISDIEAETPKWPTQEGASKEEGTTHGVH